MRPDFQLAAKISAAKNSAIKPLNNTSGITSSRAALPVAQSGQPPLPAIFRTIPR